MIYLVVFIFYFTFAPGCPVCEVVFYNPDRHRGNKMIRQYTKKMGAEHRIDLAQVMGEDGFV